MGGTPGEPLKDDLCQMFTYSLPKLHDALLEHLLHFYLWLSVKSLSFIGMFLCFGLLIQVICFMMMQLSCLNAI